MKEMEREQMSQDELKKIRRMSYIKMSAMVGIVMAVLAFSSVAWFTQSREVEGEGVQMKAAATAFEIKTRSEDGIYKSLYVEHQTDAAIWQVSASHNFNNNSDAVTEDDPEPGLEPGDRGSLEFCIEPKEVSTITLDCIFDLRAFAYVKNEETDEQELKEISTNSSLLKYLSSHIMLFKDYDPVTEKYSGLIGNGTSLERKLEDMQFEKDSDEYITIYWVWPEHLSDLTDKTKAIYKISDNEPEEEENENGFLSVIDYIANHKDGFFKDCSDTSEKVKADLLELGRTNSGQIYNRYNSKYDNADLEIGNNVNYVVISMRANEPS